MNTFSASDGLQLAYAIDDHTDPWAPKETLILLHAVLGLPAWRYTFGMLVLCAGAVANGRLAWAAPEA